MIRLTNLADYAVVLCCELAQRQDYLQSANGLSARCNIPVPTVSKILGALSRAGLLRSQRGLGGGFCLARDSGEITVADIVEAIDGPVSLTSCSDEATNDCSLSDDCAMRPHWQKINCAVRDALAVVSLADITAPVAVREPQARQLEQTTTGV